MQADPHQVNNLWGDPEHADLRFRLLQGLLTEEMNRRHPACGSYPEDFGRPPHQ